jgi:hypothetical protein
MRYYELYTLDGLATAVQFDGTLEELFNVVGQSEVLWGRGSVSKLPEVVFVRRGAALNRIAECPVEEWEKWFEVKP